MMCGSHLPPTLAKNNQLLLLFNKIATPFFNSSRSQPQSMQKSSSLLTKSMTHGVRVNRLSMNRVNHFFNVAVAAKPPTSELSEQTVSTVSNKATRRRRRESPEGVLRHKLDMCSKEGDLLEALRLYDETRVNKVQLQQHHFNVLIYLCSSPGSLEESSDENACLGLGLKRGFEILQQMKIENVAMNEATFTNAARLAAAMEDPEMAFDLVNQMKANGIPPRLRSYGPALFGFCKKGQADKAYAVDAHMVELGVIPEEPELSALLKVSIDGKNGDKVYEFLHRLRVTARQVSESTIGVIEDWFKSEDAAQLGKRNWIVDEVREGLVKGGGGWHGKGWLGSGEWKVVRTEINEKGACLSCGEKLVCIDIDPLETENFASSLSTLACQRKVKEDFNRFQEWLQQNGPFDAIVDGANMALINQKTFNFIQLNTMVNLIREKSPTKKLPLIILHTGRVHGGPAQQPKNKKLIESWKKAGALYVTPAGSNDDWYWLYAAVNCKCLLVTNDEMRDHLFQLLGTSFFPRWKEKHQVRFKVDNGMPSLCMPPPYSIVIQESEQGHWHVPTVTDDDLETPRQWLCATRPSQL